MTDRNEPVKPSEALQQLVAESDTGGRKVGGAVGQLIFWVSGALRRFRFMRRGILHMVKKEQTSSKRSKQMSNVFWDLFTGSAPYRDVFLRTLRPSFNIRLLLATLDSLPATSDGDVAAGGAEAGVEGMNPLKRY